MEINKLQRSIKQNMRTLIFNDNQPHIDCILNSHLLFQTQNVKDQN